MTGPLRVVVAEPHRPTAAALSALLASGPDDLDVTVVEDLATTGTLARRRHADVVVVDGGLLLSAPSALGVLPADTALVVLATGHEVAFEEFARRRGAAAYLRKEQAADLLPALLHDMARDGHDIARC